MRRVKVVAAMISLALGLLGGAKADEENRKTIVSFNHRVEIPGGQVLPAGKYVFKVLDPSANPNIIQILSEDEKHLYGTIMAIPTYRLRQTEKTVMTFSTKAAGAPASIRTWFYPGSTRGVEFVYPKMQPRAVDLAKLAPKPAPPPKPKPVPKKPPKVASKKHKRAKPVQPPEVATQPAPATVAALPGIQLTKEKFGVNVDVLNRVPVEFPEASREPTRPQQIPRKRNIVPDLLVVGLIVGALVLLLMSMRKVGGVVARKSAARARVKKEGRKAA